MDQNLLEEIFSGSLNNIYKNIQRWVWWQSEEYVKKNPCKTEVVIREMVLGNERLSRADTRNVNWCPYIIFFAGSNFLVMCNILYELTKPRMFINILVHVPFLR